MCLIVSALAGLDDLPEVVDVGMEAWRGIESRKS